MSATRSFLNASRPLFTHPTSFSGHARTTRFRTTFRENTKRFQSTTATPNPNWFRRMWDSPIGLKTVHFWAPMLKWAVVLAGVSDFARPAEKLSLTQNLALTATGMIWTRWCLIIKPKNILLAAVNAFLGLVGLTQLTRIFFYERSKKGTAGVIEDIKQEVKEGTPNVKV